MKKDYFKMQFTEYQLNKFELISTDKMKSSLKSVLAHLYIKNAELNRNKYIDKAYGELTISVSKFLRYYNSSTSKRNHAKRNLGLKELPLLTLSSMRKRLKTLTELGLIKNISSGTSESTFIFFATEEQYLMHESGSIKNEPESVENTTVIKDEEIHTTTSCYIKDLDSNNTSSILSGSDNVSEMDYISYIQQERKVVDFDMVCNSINRLFKLLKVRSGWIKNKVISKVCKYYHTITVKHLDSYICACIVNARAESQSKYREYVLNKQKHSSSDNKPVAVPLGFSSFKEFEYALSY